MSRRPRYQALLVVPFVVLACAKTSDVVGFDDRDGGTPGGFVSSEAGADGDNTSREPAALCMGTECPPPFATCGASHRCGINLSNDEANCGACGNVCPALPDINLISSCIEGKCHYECKTNVPKQTYGNCDKLFENGCESNLTFDPQNCGVCGRACPPGVQCLMGECGCPPGYTDCGGTCVDLNTHSAHCGECNHVCPTWDEAGLPEPPPNADYGCWDKKCGSLICKPGWGDCDEKLPNGCEINLREDESNCGHCDNKCRDDQTCATLLHDDKPSCVCEDGLTRCMVGDRIECADLLHNVNHCGACGFKCTVIGKDKHISGDCHQGRCVKSCDPGWDDCDGDPANGCETNLRIDGSNCGACGHWCNTAAGQPCVEGQCLVFECDGGGPVTK